MADGAPPRRNVAIFLDMENLFGGYSNDVTTVRIGEVVRGIEKIVREGGVGSLTASVRAYANWGRADMGAYRREMLEHGVEPVQVFSFGKNVKNAADIELCVDVLAAAHECPWIEVFVVVSGDGGFVPLIRRLHYLDKYAIVVSTNGPSSGSVNSLLASVADEYHRIDVGPQGSRPENPPAAQEGPEPGQGPAQALPAFEEFEAEARRLLEGDGQLRIAGRVNAAALGAALRQQWPGIDYTAYGFRNLKSFVEAHLGLPVHSPAASERNGADRRPPGQASPAVSAPPAEVTGRPGYVAAVRALFSEDGPLAAEAHARGALPLTVVGTRLREQISGPPYTALGYPKLTALLQNALSTTGYAVFPTADGPVVARRGTRDGQPVPDLTDDALAAPEAVRAALGTCEPPVVYPEPFVLTEVIQACLSLGRPAGVPELIEYAADQCPGVRAETIRFTLGLLWASQVLDDTGDGTGQIHLNPAITTVASALRHVHDDAEQRAARIDWPVTRTQLEDILY
ncbi:hypothetical protein GCM10012320_32810 [Sinomonas cellulolyticus]|uniref:NYN domain-containing protein n=1 Tax=Sinomonas cellulolyticus TaxID=2801916 RepID=A0ABS1JXP5_9MICC|nr:MULTISPECIES: NYN domain-containing protein [Sinomonas]MBL0703975.1 NYN domain-containing protein [Sinomonas cellulolyticus]GHG58979.1 hypothetical protein GCM10012320_32810 [Sinomonas sp. KCTC 49339]